MPYPVKTDAEMAELENAVRSAVEACKAAEAALAKAKDDSEAAYRTVQSAYKAFARASHARKALPMPTHPLNAPA
jgi:hypothetical protein